MSRTNFLGITRSADPEIRVLESINADTQRIVLQNMQGPPQVPAPNPKAFFTNHTFGQHTSDHHNQHDAQHQGQRRPPWHHAPRLLPEEHQDAQTKSGQCSLRAGEQQQPCRPQHRQPPSTSRPRQPQADQPCAQDDRRKDVWRDKPSRWHGFVQPALKHLCFFAFRRPTALLEEPFPIGFPQRHHGGMFWTNLQHRTQSQRHQDRNQNRHHHAAHSGPRCQPHGGQRGPTRGTKNQPTPTVLTRSGQLHHKPSAWHRCGEREPSINTEAPEHQRRKNQQPSTPDQRTAGAQTGVPPSGQTGGKIQMPLVDHGRENAERTQRGQPCPQHHGHPIGLIQ